MDSFINFNPVYGDISFVGNDIEISRNRNKKLTQELIILFKTEDKDYELNQDFGLDLNSFLGKPISEELAFQIRSAMLKKLDKYELVKDVSLVEILHIIDKNTIHFRIIIPGMSSLSLDFLQEKGFQVE